ncbi:hypothetical protein [Thalassospira marina]|uniref:Uncharacterized protein n=1 Tax=Thalassospira marina TaxID=2048283 RepID=A0ABN5FPM4_9PROT|nr:hypothetical protein [Thalassospira marina]AUG53499.1 hypothetical protein CSC3H3_12820 [Thalassospira marina]
MTNEQKAEERISVLSPFLDDEDKDNIAIFLVRERIKPGLYRIQGGAVQARARTGWRLDPGEWLDRRQEYGDVGDHSLLTDEEAQEYLDAMGLRLEDGKKMLIEEFRRVNGYDPVLLPVDPKFKERRDAARQRLRLPPKA